jgi:hypothetical protein
MAAVPVYIRVVPREIFASLSKIFICNSGTRRQDVEQLHDPNFAAYVIPLLLAPCVRDGGQVVCLIDYAALGVLTPHVIRPRNSFKFNGLPRI